MYRETRDNTRPEQYPWRQVAAADSRRRTWRHGRHHMASATDSLWPDAGFSRFREWRNNFRWNGHGRGIAIHGLRQSLSTTPPRRPDPRSEVADRTETKDIRAIGDVAHFQSQIFVSPRFGQAIDPLFAVPPTGLVASGIGDTPGFSILGTEKAPVHRHTLSAVFAIRADT